LFISSELEVHEVLPENAPLEYIHITMEQFVIKHS